MGMMAGLGSVLSAVATIAGSFMGGSKSAPAAPTMAPAPPPPPAPEPEPTIEPEGAADQEAARLRSIKRRQDEQARAATSLEDDSDTSGKTLLGS